MAPGRSSTSSTAEPHRLIAGRVGTPHGLDGSFVVLEPNVALLDGSTSVIVGGEVGGRGRARDGSGDGAGAGAGRAARIVRRAGHPGRYLLALEGFGDREAALGLRGALLSVERDVAPELDEDEWWADDLVGLRVVDGERTVGTVVRLLAMPSCELLEVDRRADGLSELLVPLVSDAVRTVDVEAGAIDIDLGFLGEK